MDGGGPDGGFTDGGGCSGLDAEAMSLGLPPACATCVGMMCCSQYQTCVSNSACATIEACTASCIAGGGSAFTCPGTCEAESDSGTGVKDAENFDTCIETNCLSSCI